MNNRVVVTGLGVVSPNGTGVDSFLNAIKKGKSGVKFDDKLAELNFSCKVSGRPTIDVESIKGLMSFVQFKSLENEGLHYACLAGTEAWNDAGLEVTPPDVNPDPETGVIFGTGSLAMGEFSYEKQKIVASGKPRRIGPRIVEQTMNSGAASYLNKIIGFGDVVMSNSSACSTGTEAVILGYDRIKSGRAKRMLCGSTEVPGWVIWSAFEALRILCGNSNDDPEKASRPMAADASGLVPGAGAGALVLEDLDTAVARGAKIYGEILAGNINNGGLRNGGTMTMSNYDATKKVIARSLQDAGLEGTDIDLICGHLTATIADPKEVIAWKEALDLSYDNFPMINSLKSMTGHCFSATGSIEMVASMLQLHHQFIHPNINIDEVHPDISSQINEKAVVQELVEKEINHVIKANLAFGDVNTCLVVKKWDE